MTTAPGPNGTGSPWWQSLLRARVLIGAVVVALVIWFAVANNQRVTVDWFLVETSSPLFLVILVSAVLGALADRLIRWRRQRRPSVDRR